MASHQITLLVAAHNSRPFIEACLNSILAQITPNWLCVILDDRSTDGTFEWLQGNLRINADARFRLLRNDKNIGYTCCLQRLIDEATTDIVGILDSDDALRVDCLAKVLAAYADSNEGFVYTNFTICDSELRPLRPGWCAAPPDGWTLLESDSGSHFKTFRREVYYKTGGLDDCYQYAADRDLVFKLEEVARPHFIDEPLYLYRQGHHEPEALLRRQKIGAEKKQLAIEAARVRRRLNHFSPWPPQPIPVEYSLRIVVPSVRQSSPRIAFPEPVELVIAEGQESKTLNGLVLDTPASLAIKDGSQTHVILDGVLEVARKPEKILQAARKWLRPGGCLTARVKNCRHHSIICGLMDGSWKAGADGSLRFYTRREIEKLFYRSDYSVKMVAAASNTELLSWRRAGWPTGIRVGSLAIEGLSIDAAQELLTDEFWVQVQPKEQPGRGLTSIIIVTHNQLEYTRQCLASVRCRTRSPYELIVIDNGSEDGTVDYLTRLDGVTVIRNESNRGFPAAANQGIRAAAGEHILLLNNDVIVATGWLDRLLEAMYRQEDVGLVGPCSNNVSGRQAVAASYTDLADLDGFAWDWAKANDGRADDVDRLVGFCLLIHREVIDTIGILDERFGIGTFEDDDYCVRARAAGYRLLIARDVYIHHFGSITFRNNGFDLGKVLEQNEQIFREKWREGSKTGPHIDAALRTRLGSGAETFSVRGGQGGLLLAERKPQVSCCMIVRDSGRTLEACLESIRPWVDELVVVDTGSLDQTPVIARQFGARVFRFPWCDDFSAARNESIAHALGEWVFWVDSDDTMTLENGRKLRALLDQRISPNVLGYVMQVHCPGTAEAGESEVTVVDHVKLFRNLPHLRFEGRIHEQVLPAIRRAGGDVAWTDIFVVHSGSDQSPEGRRRKQDRDLHLLNLELAEHPEHTFTLFNLGMTYADMEDHERALEFLRASLKTAEPSSSHLRKVYALIVGSLMNLNKYVEAQEVCDEALALFPRDPELTFRRGMIYHRLGALQESVEAYQHVLQGGGERHFSSIDRGIKGYKARQNLAVVYSELGDFAAAEEQWRRVVQEKPSYRPGWRGLYDNFVSQRRWDEAKLLAIQLSADPQLLVDGIVMQAQIAKREGDLQRARQLLEQLVACGSVDTVALEALCQFLFEHGELREAEHAIQMLVNSGGDSAAAHHNLGTLYVRMGRLNEAVAEYRHSLQLRPGWPATEECLRGALKLLQSKT